MVQVAKVEEKGSDVNLASHLVRDALLNHFDEALVLSNDTDMALMRDGSIVNILSGFIGLGDSGRLKAEGFRP